MTSRGYFGPLDWAVLAAYAAVVIGIGLHFSRRQRTTEEYFTGSRRMNPLLAGVSVFAAYFSVLSYVGTPGEYVQYGPMMAVVTVLSLPVVYVLVGWLIIPVIMRLPITSAFELLESRLGRGVRQLGSFSYIISRVVWLGLILYTVSTMLVHILDCDPRWTYVIAGVIAAITTTYTLIGGIRTVMVTEALQSCMLLLGIFLTLIFVSVKVGGVGAWFPHRREAHWIAQPFLSFDPHVRISVVEGFVALLIGGICYTVTDQSSVQRLLTTRDARAARKAYLLSNATVAAVNILLSLVGAALLVFYRRRPGGLPDHLTFVHNGDAFFPLFISHELPHGISGLVVAGPLAAAMACLAGGINATTTAITTDFVEVYARRKRTDAENLRTSRFLVLLLGIVAFLMSIGMGSVSGNLNEVAIKTVNLLLCPTFGLFFLAIFIRYATPFGAIMGAVYSTTAAVMLGYWDAFTGQPPFSFLWVLSAPFFVSLASGCLFSLLPTRGRSARAVGVYSIAVLAPLAVATGWVLERHG